MIGTVNIEDRIRLTMAASKMAWWEIELPSGVIFFDANKAHMIGRNPGDFIHYSDFTKLLHDDDLEQTMKSMRDYLDGKTELYECAYRIKHKDGDYRTFFDRGEIVSRAIHGEVKLMGVVIDVTESPLTVKTI